MIETVEGEKEAEPFLQSPTPTSIYICWTYKGDNPLAEYGLTTSLGTQVVPETIPIGGVGMSLNWYARS